MLQGLTDQWMHKSIPILGRAFYTFLHLNKKFSGAPAPQVNPTHVILSVGINSRDNLPKTNLDQVKQLVNSSSKFFPKAQIYIPQLNFSASLTSKERATLELLNTHLMELAGQSELESFGTIPPLPQNLFQTQKDCIHWTPNTANAMICHWLDYLN